MSKLSISHMSYSNVVVYKGGKKFYIRATDLDKVINKTQWVLIPRSGRDQVAHLVPA